MLHKNSALNFACLAELLHKRKVCVPSMTVVKVFPNNPIIYRLLIRLCVFSLVHTYLSILNFRSAGVRRAEPVKW